MVTERGADLPRIKNSVTKTKNDRQTDCDSITSVFFVCGGNDVEKFKNLGKAKSDYKALMECTKSAFPNATINVISLIPRRTIHQNHCKDMDLMNKWLATHCRQQNTRFVNIFSFFIDKKSGDLNYNLFQRDELHLSKIGCSVLAKVLIAVANKPRSMP